jgi:hypothetical protein
MGHGAQRMRQVIEGTEGLLNAPWFAKKKNCSYLFMYYVDPGFEKLFLYEKH